MGISVARQSGGPVGRFQNKNASMYDLSETELLYVTQRSPTTQLLAVSPDRMIINRDALIGTYQGDSNEKFNRTISKLALYQRACKLGPGDRYEDCFVRPFGHSFEVKDGKGPEAGADRVQ